ncbi:hypothetical protein LCGC14_1780060, partial [marine sediment metagenome]
NNSPQAPYEVSGRYRIVHRYLTYIGRAEYKHSDKDEQFEFFQNSLHINLITINLITTTNPTKNVAHIQSIPTIASHRPNDILLISRFIKLGSAEALPYG